MSLLEDLVEPLSLTFDGLLSLLVHLKAVSWIEDLLSICGQLNAECRQLRILAQSLNYLLMFRRREDRRFLSSDVAPTCGSIPEIISTSWSFVPSSRLHPYLFEGSHSAESNSPHIERSLQLRFLSRYINPCRPCVPSLVRIPFCHGGYLQLEWPSTCFITLVTIPIRRAITHQMSPDPYGLNACLLDIGLWCSIFNYSEEEKTIPSMDLEHILPEVRRLNIQKGEIMSAFQH